MIERVGTKRIFLEDLDFRDLDDFFVPSYFPFAEYITFLDSFLDPKSRLRLCAKIKEFPRE